MGKEQSSHQNVVLARSSCRVLDDSLLFPKFFSPLNGVFISLTKMPLRFRELPVEQFAARAIIPPVDRNDASVIHGKQL